MSNEVERLFARCEPQVLASYHAVVEAARSFGPVGEEAKKTSIHLTAGSGFAGAHPQKGRLRLNIRLARALDGPRTRKVEKVSASRFHNEVDLDSPAAVDDELTAWLGEAYALAASRRGTVV